MPAFYCPRGPEHCGWLTLAGSCPLCRAPWGCCEASRGGEVCGRGCFRWTRHCVGACHLGASRRSWGRQAWARRSSACRRRFLLPFLGAFLHRTHRALSLTRGCSVPSQVSFPPSSPQHPAWRRDLGGGGGAVVYFDTENKFSSIRIAQMAGQHGPKGVHPEETMAQVRPTALQTEARGNRDGEREPCCLLDALEPLVLSRSLAGGGQDPRHARRQRSGPDSSPQPAELGHD